MRARLAGLTVCLCIILPAVVYSRSLFEGFETPKSLLVAVLGSAALAMGCSRDALARWRWTSLDVAMLVWIAAASTSTIAAPAPLLSVFGEPGLNDGLVTSLSLCALYFAMRLAHREMRSLFPTVGTATGAALGFMALSQVWWPPSSSDWARHFPLQVGPVTFERPFLPVGNPITLGLVLAMATGPAATRALSGQRDAWLGIVSMSVLTPAVMVTCSRAAWISMGISLLTVCLLAEGPRRRGAMVLATAGVVLGLVVALGIGKGSSTAIVARALETLDAGSVSWSQRWSIWTTALDAWRASPWLGHGPGSVNLVFPAFQKPSFDSIGYPEGPGHAHGTIPQLLVTGGLLAVGSALAVVWTALRSAQLLRRRQNQDCDWATATLAAGMAGGSVNALGVTGAVLIVVSLGVFGNVIQESDSATTDDRSRERTRLSVPLTAGAALACLAMIWLGGRELAGSRALDRAMAGWERLEGASGSEHRDTVRMIEASAERGASLLFWSDLPCVWLAQARSLSATHSLDPCRSAGMAVRAAEEAVRRAPIRASNHLRLAELLETHATCLPSDAHARALDQAQIALRLAPNSALTLLGVAHLELIGGHAARALSASERISATWPRLGQGQLVRALALHALGRDREARAALSQSLTLDWGEDQAGLQRARELARVAAEN